MKRASMLYASPAWLLAGLALLFPGCGRSSPAATQPAPLETRTNSIGMRLVHIAAGSFLMGHPSGLAGAGPVHRVELSDFWIGQYEVTNAQYDRFKKRPRPPTSPTDRQPAGGLSWYDAVAFCQWLSRKEGRCYRLPTEAEWEYAARGGLVQKDYPWGNQPPDGRAAVARQDTIPVGSYPLNGFGLYDVAGNVEEWVSDWLDEDYYRRSPAKDPTGPAEPPKIPERVNRGGNYSVWEPYVWLRGSADPSWVYDFYGFRVVLDPRQKGSAPEPKPGGNRGAGERLARRPR